MRWGLRRRSRPIASSALRTFVYPAANMKQPVQAALSLGSRLAVSETVGDYVKLATGGFVYGAHVVPIGHVAADAIATAETFLNVPYLWGGRSSLGLDCSGLVQHALVAAGIAAPRDSDMHQARIGSAIEIGDDLAGLRRGDMISWKGHCGLMRDATTLLHANGYHMMVASEPLRIARDRILAKSFGPITLVKRLVAAA